MEHGWWVPGRQRGGGGLGTKGVVGGGLKLRVVLGRRLMRASEVGLGLGFEFAGYSHSLSRRAFEAVEKNGGRCGMAESLTEVSSSR